MITYLSYKFLIYTHAFIYSIELFLYSIYIFEEKCIQTEVNTNIFDFDTLGFSLFYNKHATYLPTRQNQPTMVQFDSQNIT